METLCFTEKNGTLTASVQGELDHCLATSVRERIDNELYRRRPDRLILDLSGVTFMDSSGLGLIMGRYTACKNAGAKFVLCGADERAEKIISMAGLGSVIAIDRTKKERSGV